HAHGWSGAVVHPPGQHHVRGGLLGRVRGAQRPDHRPLHGRAGPGRGPPRPGRRARPRLTDQGPTAPAGHLRRAAAPGPGHDGPAVDRRRSGGRPGSGGERAGSVGPGPGQGRPLRTGSGGGEPAAPGGLSPPPVPSRAAPPVTAVTPPDPTSIGGDADVSGAPPALLRSAATITAWNAVSRVSGFVRVLAVGAAVGTTFLGNTYQSANLVSNVLFDVVAAGLLSAPLVPVFVSLLDRRRHQDAERLAGSVLSLSLVGLGGVVVVGVIARAGIMRLLTADVHDAAVRAAEVRLGAFLLWFFLPQVVLYGVGALATAVLHATHRFAAASAAPVANNVVVTATMVAFAVM